MRCIVLIAALTGVTACDYVPPFLGGYTYRAEVGYYEDGKQTWFVGIDKSRDACISEATARYNSINAASPRRASHGLADRCRERSS